MSTQSRTKSTKSHKANFEQWIHIMQRLPATIPHLVKASPSATDDGALLLGSHSSSVFVVDGKSGALLRVLSPGSQQALDRHHAGTFIQHSSFMSFLLSNT